MSDARASIHAMFQLDEAVTAELDTRLDALVVEVRRTDAAHLLDQRHHHIHRAIFCDGIKYSARLLEKRADENTEKATAPAATDTPEFFQPGHAYRNGLYTFHCSGIGPHPYTGETRAVGWLTHQDRGPEVWAMDPDDWGIAGWNNAEVSDQ